MAARRARPRPLLLRMRRPWRYYAPWLRRLLAGFVDFLVWLPMAAAVLLLRPTPQTMMEALLLFWWLMAPLAGFMTFCNGAFGATPGNMLFGHRLLSERGGRLGFGRALLLTMILLIYVLVLLWLPLAGAVAAFPRAWALHLATGMLGLMAFFLWAPLLLRADDPRDQRPLHFRLAGCVMIKARTLRRFRRELRKAARPRHEQEKPQAEEAPGAPGEPGHAVALDP